MAPAFWIVAPLVAFFFAICWSAKQGYFGWTYNAEIKPVELAALLLNIGIALYLQFYFVRRSANHRVEKDLLIADLKDLLAVLDEIRKTFSDAYANGDLVSSAVPLLVREHKRFDARLQQFEFTLKLSHASALEKKLSPLKDRAINLKRVGTGPTPATRQFAPKEEIRHQDEWRQLRESILAFIFAVNSQS